MNIQPTDIRITKAFITPLVTHRIADSLALNERLKQIALRAEQQYPSIGRSNIGGWRSHHDLFDNGDAALETLLTSVRAAALQLIKITAGAEGFNGYLKINGWANILRSGNYNTLHNHPESAWSGVYYVDAGTQQASHPLSGILELMDPRPGVEMAPTPGMPFGLPIRIQPEAGLMVLFPSWLYHHVHPYAGTAARISIAFNVATLNAAAPALPTTAALAR